MAFNVKDILHNKATALLHQETEPGLGCTEPAAIGLCAAGAATLVPDQPIQTMEVTVNPNLFKNAMGVIIPGSGGGHGIALAAALGAIACRPDLKLQVFAAVTPDILTKAGQLVQENRVALKIKEGEHNLFVQVILETRDHTAKAVISSRHDRFAALSLDDQPMLDHPLLEMMEGPAERVEELEKWLASLSLETMVDLIGQLDSDDLAYIEEGLAMNLKLAQYGLMRSPGLGVGQALQSLVRQGLIKKDMAQWAGIVTAAGIDARMGGVNLPAMTLGGSGNQGIAASLPISAAREFAVIDADEVLFKAVTLSYLVTCYIKSLVGPLSALCGSGVAAGAGAAAGVTYLLGGTVDKIGGAVSNHLENFATVVCDGAKTSCALKVGEAASSAVKSALLALQGVAVRPADGFMAASPEKTMQNLGDMAGQGLSCMDPVIVRIMRDKFR